MVESKDTIATPPGTIIQEQLESLGISQQVFADRMDLSEAKVEQLIQGELHLTQEIAIKLENVLGVPENFWQTLEEIYRQKLERVARENA